MVIGSLTLAMDRTKVPRNKLKMDILEMKTRKSKTEPKRVTSNLIIGLIIDITYVLRNKEQKYGCSWNQD